MFSKVYRTTISNLIRSRLFFLLFIVITSLMLYEAIQGFYGYYDFDLKEHIEDTDPRFVLNYQTYIKHICNSCISNVMLYAMPIFTISTVVLIIRRDLSDRYYEIEKAAGISPTIYLFGRFAALITVNFLVATYATYLTHSVYVFTRNGVSSMGILETIIDSVVRLGRWLLLIEFPAIAFYITLVYGIGILFKNGIIGAGAGLSYVIFNLASITVLNHRISKTYKDYISPIPDKITDFLYYYDTPWFDDILATQNTGPREVILCLSYSCCAIVLGLGISYWCVRKRNI